MLIECPECKKQVSNLAKSCVNCGYPMELLFKAEKLVKSANTQPQRKKRRMKLPNGFGSIKKLSGRRRKPYAVYPPTKEFSLSGTPITQPAIGYYEDWYKALEALQEYNKKPYDIKAQKVTFAELYDMYYADKFENGKKEYAKKTKENHRVAFKNCPSIHNMTYSELRKEDFQKVLDDCPLKKASLENIKMLFTGMGRYAISKEIIDTDFSQFTVIGIDDDEEKGEPFSQKAIDKLWKNSNDPSVQKILIMIYSGFRIKAFEDMKVDWDKKYFQGGVKTKSSKDRIVPIHPLIFDFVQSLGNPIFKTANRFRADEFTPTLFKLDLLYENGKKHTPHDCRHTFSWLCDKYDVDGISKRMFMGHTLGKDVSDKVYSHRTYEELVAEMKKIKR